MIARVDGDLDANGGTDTTPDKVFGSALFSIVNCGLRVHKPAEPQEETAPPSRLAKHPSNFHLVRTVLALAIIQIDPQRRGPEREA